MMRVGYGVDPAIGLAILSSFNSPAIETSTTYDTVPLATDPYFAIGDSVMLGASRCSKPEASTPLPTAPTTLRRQSSNYSR